MNSPNNAYHVDGDGMESMGVGRRDDSGLASTVVAFLIAGMLFIASVVGLLLMTQSGAQDGVGGPAATATAKVEAAGLADILLGSAGYADGAAFDHAGAAANGSMPAADRLDRLGLMDAQSGTGMLDFAKLQNLRRAPMAANGTDGYVNYEEAARTLGLSGAGLAFHIRAYPSLPTVRELQTTQSRDHNMRVTYVGDINVTPTTTTAMPSNPAEGLTSGCTPAAPTCASPTTTCDKAGAGQPAGYPPVPPGSYRIGTWVHNGGTTETQFSGTFHFSHTGSNAGGTQDPADQGANTWLVPAGGWVFLYVDVPATARFGGCDGNSVVTVNVRDLGTASLTQATDPASLPNPPASQSPKDMWLDSGRPYYRNPSDLTSGCPEPVTFTYSGSNTGGGGNGANGQGNGQPFKDSWMYLTIETSAGAQVASKSFVHPGNAAGATISTIGNVPICLPAGGYTATLYFCNSSSTPCNSPALSAGKERTTERFLVSHSTIPPYSPVPIDVTGPDLYTSQPSSLIEVEYLSKLVDSFCPYIYERQNTTDIPAMTGPPSVPDRCIPFQDPARTAAGMPAPTQYGDVLPDSTSVLNSQLPKRLATDPPTCAHPRYDITNVLIVGSNVNQNAMTNPDAKNCVAAWIAGGGTLVVLGSAEQNAGWLSEVIEAAIQSSSGALSAPDAGHPLLHAPEELEYPGYDNRGRVWTFAGATAAQADSLFSNVFVQGGSPVTTISNPGALAEGDLLLTTWTPYDVYDGAGDPTTTYDEGLKLMHNLLMQSYRDLYLDYGPPLPAGANVVPAVHFTAVQHPGFPDAIPMRVIVYVFPEG